MHKVGSSMGSIHKLRKTKIRLFDPSPSPDTDVICEWVLNSLKIALWLLQSHLFLIENIANDYWLNGGVRFVAKMPLLTIGKVDRQYFKNLVKDELLTEIAPSYGA